MGLNHSETVYSVKRFEKVRYSRTTPNSRQRQSLFEFWCDSGPGAMSISSRCIRP